MGSSRGDRIKGAWLFGLLLSIVIFNYPFALIFNRSRLVFGLPLAVLFLMGGWLLFIGGIYLFVRRLDRRSGNEPPCDDGDGRST